MHKVTLLKFIIKLHLWAIQTGSTLTHLQKQHVSYIFHQLVTHIV